MLTKESSKVAVERNEVIAKTGYDVKKFGKVKVQPLSDARKAQLLNVPVAALKLPIVLSPSRPLKGESSLTLFSSIMVDPTYPAESGEALYTSAYQGAVFPGAQVAFPRIKKGKMHLVEFNLVLNMDITYHFRVFQYPLADFQDISVKGPAIETLVALVPPVDEIDGDLELGASIQQRNTVNDNAGWALYSVSITTTT